MLRNDLSIRKATDVSQQKRREPGFEETILTNYLIRLKVFLSPYQKECVLQCDETPVYFDMLGSSTIDFVGTNTVDLVTTGHEKTRFTVLLTIAADGFALSVYLVFRGLKKIPNCPIPANIIVNVNDSGSIDRYLMMDYLRKVVKTYLRGRNGGLVMDSFRAHFVDEVVEYMSEIDVKGLAIPGGFTAVAQPLDVVCNKPFKDYMKEEWDTFIKAPVNESDFTQSGNRKKPSYEQII